MIGRQQGEGALDLREVARDDDLLDLLASRHDVDAPDRAARLLTAFAAEVDEGLADLLAGAAGVPAGVGDPVEPADQARPGSPPRRGRRTTYGTALAVVLGASLSVSGVAAAVTGDPFAPYRAVGGALSWGDDDLPATAADIAHLNKRLAGARAAIARGQVTGAQERLAALRLQVDEMDLTQRQRAAFERKLDRLETALAQVGPSSGEPGRGRVGDPATDHEPGGAGRQAGNGSGAGGSSADQDASQPKADQSPNGSPDEPQTGQTSKGTPSDPERSGARQEPVTKPEPKAETEPEEPVEPGEDVAAPSTSETTELDTGAVEHGQGTGHKQG